MLRSAVTSSKGFAANLLGLLTIGLSISLAQDASPCGSVDRTSSEAIKHEVTRIFNETLDRMEYSTSEGVRAATWMGWSVADEEQIKCLGMQAVPFVVEHLESQRSFGQLLAVKMLGWLGGKEIVLPLAGILKKVNSEPVKFSALESLFAAPESEARPILSDISKSDPDPSVREWAARILARYDRSPN
jgi:hypothetical protein